MNNERISKFALEGKVKSKWRLSKLKITWLPTALKKCDLNLGEAIETANNRSDWIHEALKAFLCVADQRSIISKKHFSYEDTGDLGLCSKPFQVE